MARSIRHLCIAAVRRYAASTDGKLSIRPFCLSQRVDEARMHQAFPGGLRELLRAAGLEHRACRKDTLSFDQLMLCIDEAARIAGGMPCAHDIDRLGRLNSRTYLQRLGSWKKACLAYTAWLKSKSRPFPAAAAIRGTLPSPKPNEKSREKPRDKSPDKSPDISTPQAAPAPIPPGTGIVGQPLSLPGMLFAPTNESGVLVLFGLLANRLGYVVEHVRTAFPDCLALRPLDPKSPAPDRWRRLAVEFEYKSSNFRVHGHDPAACDLIVCWEDDWKDCPIEVLELRSNLPQTAAA